MVWTEALLAILEENIAKEKTLLPQNSLQEIWRQDSFFYLCSGKNHSYRRDFAVKKTRETDTKSLGDTKLGSLGFPIKASEHKYL